MKSIYYKEFYVYSIIFITSVILEILISFIRGSVGLDVSTIIGFIFYFGLCVIYIRKYNSYPRKKILFSIIAGIFILQLPMRFISFNSSLSTFLEFIIQLFGIAVAFCVFYIKNIKLKFLSSFLFLIFILIIPVLTKYWLNKLNYGTFTSAVYKKNENTILGIDNYGNEVSSESYRGKIMVLDFWHTRCSACFKKFPILQELNEKYSNNVNIEILAINKPLKQDTVDQSFNAILERGYTFRTVLPYDSSISDKFEIKRFPTTLIINQAGFIVFNGAIEDAITHIEKAMN